MKDHETVPDDRRARRTPFERRDVVGTEVQAAEIDLPEKIAVHVVGVDALRSERRDDDAAVGGGCRAGVRRLDVPLVDRLAFVRDAFPQNFSTVLVEGVDHPAVPRAIVGGVAVAVEARTERRIRPAADRRRHEDAGAPDDGAGHGDACHRRFPQDVLARLAVPPIGKMLAFGDAGRVRSSEGRPTAGWCAGIRERGQRRGGGSHDPPDRHRLGLAFGTPRASIQNHPARHTLIRDEIEAESRALDAKPVPARSIAALRRGGCHELHPFRISLPTAPERGPALTFQQESTVSREADNERAELQRRRRERRRRLLTEHARRTHTCERQRERDELERPRRASTREPDPDLRRAERRHPSGPDGEHEADVGPKSRRRQRDVEDGAEHTDGRNPDGDREGAQHPFPMAGDPTGSNENKRPTYGKQEQPSKHCDRDRFGRSSERDQETKVQAAQSSDEGRHQQHAPGPPMKRRVSRSHARRQLNRCQDQEHRARDDVQERHHGVSGIPPVEPIEIEHALSYHE